MVYLTLLFSVDELLKTTTVLLVLACQPVVAQYLANGNMPLIAVLVPLLNAVSTTAVWTLWCLFVMAAKCRNFLTS